MGAALAARVDGELVLDLWGGAADPRTGTPWREETATVLFSATKGLVSILAARLVQEERLDLDAPVMRYWHEFGQAGKSRITVRQLLSHQAGLSATLDSLSLDDVLAWEPVVRSLELQEPLWPIGEGHAYHALTFGWLAGELIRRVTGESVGQYFRDLVTDPLDVEAWIGIPASEEYRVAFISSSKGRLVQIAERVAGGSDNGIDFYDRALTLGGAFPTNLVSPSGGFNDPRTHAAEIPGAGGIATARALATIWSATVTTTEGIRLLSQDTVAEMTKVQSEGWPVFALDPPYLSWGTGFEIPSPAREYLSASSFGHDGSGGQIGFADPAFKVGFAYVTNYLEGAGDERANSVIRALRRALS
jgi:CubicO group peptidase (beta-lactamase class C family)